MLRRTFCLAVAAALIATAGCGGDAGDAAFKDRIAAMNAYAEAMEKGESDAKVKELGEQLGAAEQKYHSLKLSDAEKKKLDEKYKEEFLKAGLRMGAARAKQPGGSNLTGLAPPGVSGGVSPSKK
jgi:hypothetical protein